MTTVYLQAKCTAKASFIPGGFPTASVPGRCAFEPAQCHAGGHPHFHPGIPHGVAQGRNRRRVVEELRHPRGVVPALPIRPRTCAGRAANMDRSADKELNAGIGLGSPISPNASRKVWISHSFRRLAVLRTYQQ
jgi:hypothetical protein